MNNTIISGYLANEPELKVLDENKQVCKFRVGVRFNSERTVWYGVEVWGDRAEQVNKNIPLGKKVIVNGTLKPEIHIWHDKENQPCAGYEMYGNVVEW